jgi:hypothetical protein
MAAPRLYGAEVCARAQSADMEGSMSKPTLAAAAAGSVRRRIGGHTAARLWLLRRARLWQS